mmetsp:Transcript_30816/g.89058  ORF Transcript_30816/g.89058 Transcript_30816/m.89058 type:complete len:795 (-) Transcript_30816:112-2496(-)
MGIERISANSEQDFTVKSVDYIEECIVRFQHNSLGSFVLGLSGTNGSVRRTRLADVLQSLASRRNIDWQRVFVFLVDERYGFEREEDCNAFLVRDSLVKQLAKHGADFPEEHLVLPDTSITPVEACAAKYKEQLEDLLDREHGPHLITLGLGQDLHIASVFPEWYRAAPERWAEATRKTVGVLCTETTMFEVRQRISVNLRVIRKATSIMLFLSDGTEEAWDCVKKAFNEERFSERKPKRARRTIEPTGVMLSPADGVMMWSAKAPKSKVSEPPPVSPLDYVLKYSNVSVLQLRIDKENHYSLVVLGAAGDLAKKKTFPSIFQLLLGRFLPANTSIIGVDDPAFHSDIKGVDDFWDRRLRPHLEKVTTAKEDLQEFRSRLSFVPVRMDNADSVEALNRHIHELGHGKAKDNRVFYLALPSFLFAPAVKALKTNCWSSTGFCRVIVEKPFGKNGQQAAALSDSLKGYLQETETYRIDHYLAKTLVLNLLTLRFANRELGHLFHSHHVANVRITFKEAIGVSGRAGYFDGYGIIRDIMQNHLMQVLTLVAMEAPASLAAEDVRDEKVKVLKQIRPIDPKECVIGQYDGYQDDPDIQKLNAKKGYASRCPTFATVVLYLDNERWSGVPFIMKAGKALEVQSTIVRIQFKKAPPNSLFGDQPQNELVIRIQPNEAIYYKILAKMPGLTQRAKDVQQTVLDLDLKKRFELRRTPEAYEKLIHDVIQGESHNFVRRDELEEAWRIFDPLLHHMEEVEKRVPERYTFGSRGPLKADALIDSMGFRRYTITGVPGFAEDDFD